MRDDDLRLQAAYDNSYFGARLGCVLNSAIGKSHVLAHGYAHHLGSPCRFFGTQRRCAPACHLTRRQIEDTGRSPEHLRPDQRPAAYELHVVGMGGDCEYIDSWHAGESTRTATR